MAPQPDPSTPHEKKTAQALPQGLPIAGAQSPCQENACRLCCFDTRMPLLESDIERLEAKTGASRKEFSKPDEETQTPRLRNIDGHCTFLGETGCTVYEDRPAGCRLYPLVLDPDTHQGVLDPECPHTKGFRVRPRDRAALKELVGALGLG